MESIAILGREIEGIELTLSNCLNCSDAKSAIEVMKSVVRFLDPRPKNPDRTMVHPENARIEKNGSIEIRLDITHPVLARDASSLGLGWQIGVAGFFYYARSNSVQITQTNSSSGKTIEEMVQGFVKLAELVSPVLGANYGTIEVASDYLMPRRVSRFRDIRFWCYANVFSTKLVNYAPAGFFEQCPCADRKLLSDGSFLIKSTKFLAEWYLSPPSDLSSYLSAKAPHIQLFRQG